MGENGETDIIPESGETDIIPESEETDIAPPEKKKSDLDTSHWSLQTLLISVLFAYIAITIQQQGEKLVKVEHENRTMKEMLLGASQLSGREERVVVEHSTMPYDMQQDALFYTSYAMKRFRNQTEIASFIKQEFDQRHLFGWHCIVGTFTSAVVHDTNRYVDF